MPVAPTATATPDTKRVGGSRGADLVAGAREVKIHRDHVPVRATVSAPDGFSGPADADELMAWLRQMPGKPQQTFVVRGETVRL